MQIFVKTPEPKTLCLEVQDNETFATIFEKLQESEDLDSECTRFVYGGKQLNFDCTIAEFNTIEPCHKLSNNSTLYLTSLLNGGILDPTLKALARKYNCDKMICRKCYARLPPRATNCRKKKCGHSNQLRPKKKGKKD
ncbi:Polyubiquitin [Coelomomyces lativittatus]|nr:Polyubiquitin [Coelomomyces lativittatus]KAJ1509680.1 Polyubiquitin [Coelomomyces lativittatus]